MSEDGFVEVVTQGQSVAPLYFAYTADTNRRQRDLLDDAEPSVRLTIDDLERCVRDDAVIVDSRPPETFVADDGRETEAKVRLARIGFDRVRGAVVDVERFLTERPDLAARATRLPARDLASWRDDDPGLRIVDVRNPSEQEAGMVPGAVSVPLARLLEYHRELDATAPTVVYCAGGYRSSTAASFLRSVGFVQVADLQGGYDAWSVAGLPTVRPDTA